jgi:hypothetical protein
MVPAEPNVPVVASAGTTKFTAAAAASVPPSCTVNVNAYVSTAARTFAIVADTADIVSLPVIVAEVALATVAARVAVGTPVPAVTTEVPATLKVSLTPREVPVTAIETGAVQVVADARVTVNGETTAAVTVPAAVAPVPATALVEARGVPVAALAETAEIPPIANAAAATSATRLKAVFVDIIFLSDKVDWEHFSRSAWSKNALS